MPFQPDEEQNSPSSPTPSDPLALSLSNGADARTQASNPIINKISNPSTPPTQRQATLDVMKAEAQHQKGILDKFLGGLQSTADFFDKKLHFGDVANFAAGTSGRVLGDFAGTAVESASKLANKPIDYGFTKDLNQITSSPTELAKTGTSLALELFPGGEEGNAAIKGAARKIGLGKAVEVAEKASGAIKGAAGNIIKKVLPVEKVAEFLTNVGSKNFKFIKDNPEVYSQMKHFAEDDSALPAFGEKVYDLAKNLKKTASEEWQKTEESIIKNASEKLPSGIENLKKMIGDKFSKEKIISGAEGALDYGKSAFSQNPAAQGILDRLHSLTNAPIETVDELLTKRSELTDLAGEVPKTARNLKRIVSGVVDTFDHTLNNITDGKAELMRQAYQSKVNPAYQIIDKMTDANGKFSADRALSFIKQVISDAKFDNKQVISELEDQLNKAGINGEDLGKKVQGLGAAKKTSALAPPTGSRVKDVIFTYGIGKVPVLSALVSPKFWAEAIGKSGSKISKSAITKLTNGLKDDAVKLIMQKVVGNAIKNTVSPSSLQEDIPQQSLNDRSSPNFTPDEEATISDTTNTSQNNDGSISSDVNNTDENKQIFFW